MTGPRRLPSVTDRFHRAGYVEATVPFRCGTCDWIGDPVPQAGFDGTQLAFCRNPVIRAPVHPKLGCCNYWKNAQSTVKKY